MSCIDRRTVLKSAGALSALAFLPVGCATFDPRESARLVRPIRPASIRGAFFYPPQEVVLRGECEDGWSRFKWSTWPGNQFEPEAQQAKFTRGVEQIAADLDVTLDLEPQSIYTDAGIAAFVESLSESPPGALLLFNFWNSFSKKLAPILDAYDGPIVLYHPVGASHQLPPAHFRNGERVQYIHSVENWDALERGLRSVHAHARMAQSRLLRVSGRLQEEADDSEPFFGTAIHGVPAGHYNDLFDEIEVTSEMESLAGAIRSRALRVTDLTDDSFLDATRAHEAVCRLMQRHDADAITIECLMLGHRKPCLSFSIHNGMLVPCGCENDLNASLSLMLGAGLFGRGGFQHNPDFDTVENLYFASHCTCATQLHGPQGVEASYDLKPFFHQLPKTPALDVVWPAGEPVTLFKFHTRANRLDAWGGRVVESPACPPTGGCATRVLVEVDGVDDVCSVYPGPHPILYCGDFTRQVKTFAQLYGMEVRTNA